MAGAMDGLGPSDLIRIPSRSPHSSLARPNQNPRYQSIHPFTENLHLSDIN